MAIAPIDHTQLEQDQWYREVSMGIGGDLYFVVRLDILSFVGSDQEEELKFFCI